MLLFVIFLLDHMLLVGEVAVGSEEAGLVSVCL